MPASRVAFFLADLGGGAQSCSRPRSLSRSRCGKPRRGFRALLGLGAGWRAGRLCPVLRLSSPGAFLEQPGFWLLAGLVLLADLYPLVPSMRDVRASVTFAWSAALSLAAVLAYGPTASLLFLVSGLTAALSRRTGRWWQVALNMIIFGLIGLAMAAFSGVAARAGRRCRGRLAGRLGAAAGRRGGAALRAADRRGHDLVGRLDLAGATGPVRQERADLGGQPDHRAAAGRAGAVRAMGAAVDGGRHRGAQPPEQHHVPQHRRIQDGQPDRAGEPADADPFAVRPDRPAGRQRAGHPAVDRPRPVQGRQRHLRASGRRRGADHRREPASGGGGAGRSGRPLWRRRVRGRARRAPDPPVRSPRQAETFRAALAEPIIVGDVQVVVGGSVGIAAADDPTIDVLGLVEQADQDLYRAKRGEAGRAATPERRPARAAPERAAGCSPNERRPRWQPIWSITVQGAAATPRRPAGSARRCTGPPRAGRTRTVVTLGRRSSRPVHRLAVRGRLTWLIQSGPTRAGVYAKHGSPADLDADPDPPDQVRPGQSDGAAAAARPRRPSAGGWPAAVLALIAGFTAHAAVRARPRPGRRSSPSRARSSCWR